MPSTFCCPTHAIICVWGGGRQGGGAREGGAQGAPNERRAVFARARQATMLPLAWEMLINEPLEPAVTMRTTLLVSRRLCCAWLPASSRALLSTWFTWFSNDSITVRPGCCSRSLVCGWVGGVGGALMKVLPGCSSVGARACRPASDLAPRRALPTAALTCTFSTSAFTPSLARFMMWLMT